MSETPSLVTPLKRGKGYKKKSSVTKTLPTKVKSLSKIKSLLQIKKKKEEAMSPADRICSIGSLFFFFLVPLLFGAIAEERREPF